MSLRPECKIHVASRDPSGIGAFERDSCCAGFPLFERPVGCWRSAFQLRLAIHGHDAPQPVTNAASWRAYDIQGIQRCRMLTELIARTPARKPVPPTRRCGATGSHWCPAPAAFACDGHEPSPREPVRRNGRQQGEAGECRTPAPSESDELRRREIFLGTATFSRRAVHARGATSTTMRERL